MPSGVVEGEADDGRGGGFEDVSYFAVEQAQRDRVVVRCGRQDGERTGHGTTCESKVVFQ